MTINHYRDYYFNYNRHILYRSLITCPFNGDKKVYSNFQLYSKYTKKKSKPSHSRYNFTNPRPNINLKKKFNFSYKPPPGPPPGPPPPPLLLPPQLTDKDYNPADSVFFLPPLHKTSAKDSLSNISSFIANFLDDAKLVNKKEEEEDNKDLPFEILKEKIETISDLIKLGEKYEEYKETAKRYNLNLKRLHKLVEPLKDLEKMIGMKNIKNSIFNKIILNLQGLNNDNLDYNHIVLYGSPGMGKTHVAKIIGNIYAKMGILSKGEFVEAKITDLKGGFVGQSELKTQELLDKCKGSVLFLDEAYSLGASDKIDSFSQSIIDIINPFLDKYKHDFILIIAGYKDDLDNRFFKGNQGLKSRFGLFLQIEPYTAPQLLKIFKKKIKDYNWEYKKDIKEEFFANNIENFKFFGRDIETLFSKCKISHAKRVLFSQEDEKKKLSKIDLDEGFKLFLKDKGIDKDEEEATKFMLASLYT